MRLRGVYDTGEVQGPAISHIAFQSGIKNAHPAWTQGVRVAGSDGGSYCYATVVTLPAGATPAYCPEVQVSTFPRQFPALASAGSQTVPPSGSRNRDPSKDRKFSGSPARKTGAHHDKGNLSLNLVTLAGKGHFACK